VPTTATGMTTGSARPVSPFNASGDQRYRGRRRRQFAGPARGGRRFAMPSELFISLCLLHVPGGRSPDCASHPSDPLRVEYATGIGPRLAPGGGGADRR
jgi:hypothetical protein